jgi:hypothetical protein
MGALLLHLRADHFELRHGSVDHAGTVTERFGGLDHEVDEPIGPTGSLYVANDFDEFGHRWSERYAGEPLADGSAPVKPLYVAEESRHFINGRWRRVEVCEVELIKSTEGSPEEAELSTLADVIDAYEAKRWPNGKVAGGKGWNSKGANMFRRKTVPLNQMPDDKFATIRRLSDDGLHSLMEGTKPHAASYIAAKREVQWRQDRTHLFVQYGALAISVLSLLVAVSVAVFKWRNRGDPKAAPGGIERHSWRFAHWSLQNRALKPP